MRVLSVVGNRPQFIKSAPALGGAPGGRDRRGRRCTRASTTTRSCRRCSSRELGARRAALPARRARLRLRRACGRASVRRSRDEGPDWVLVYGDTNSTYAGAEAAGSVPVAHVEAGLRSFDQTMPEERNRIAVDGISALLLCPDERSAQQLEQEGVDGPDRSRRRRDGRRVAALRAARARAVDVLERLGLEPGGYAVATVHRQANVTIDKRLRRIVEGLGASRRRSSSPRTRGRAPRSQRLGLDAADDRAARLPRLRRARVAGARDPHRLRRPAEGGVLVRRAVRDAATLDGMGRHRRRGGERARRRRSRRDRARQPARRRCRSTRPALYGDGYASERVAAALYPSRP